MKLLIISDMYPSKENPISGAFIEEQVEHLKKYNAIRVMVIGRRFVRIGIRSFLRYMSQRKEGRGDTNRREDNKREQDVIRIEYPVFIVIRRPLHIFNGMAAYLTAYNKLKKTGFRPDLIYAHKSFPAGYVGWKLKENLNIPVVTMEFQGPFSSYFNEPYRGKRVIETIKHVDRTIYTKFQLKEIQAYGVSGDKLGLAYFGVDTERFFFDKEVYKSRRTEIKNGKIKLLVVGRIEEAKGIQYLIQAIEVLKGEFHSICLSIVGILDRGGREILDSIKAKELENNISYMGVSPQKELQSVINNHDILISPSLNETFGLTIIEAMACGKPVVATKCGGPEETVNEKTGVVVEKADAEALAAGIRYVIEHYENYNPEEIREYAVKNFSQQVVIERLNNLFDQILKGKKFHVRDSWHFEF